MDPHPDPAIFIIGLQDAKKNYLFFTLFLKFEDLRFEELTCGPNLGYAELKSQSSQVCMKGRGWATLSGHFFS
jgi:hypothetical protein